MRRQGTQHGLPSALSPGTVPSSNLWVLGQCLLWGPPAPSILLSEPEFPGLAPLYAHSSPRQGAAQRVPLFPAHSARLGSSRRHRTVTNWFSHCSCRLWEQSWRPVRTCVSGTVPHRVQGTMAGKQVPLTHIATQTSASQLKPTLSGSRCPHSSHLPL